MTRIGLDRLAPATLTMENTLRIDSCQDPRTVLPVKARNNHCLMHGHTSWKAVGAS